eukprot:PhM_4_TR6084/c0_g1_i1/m.74644/K03256/TRM6, GCD10; tRNA (adenine-N(1)-)-methyltransferase non-catalytic subunit
MPATVAHDSNVVQEGDYIVLTGGKTNNICRVTKSNTFRLGRLGTITLGSLLGLPYGCSVEFDREAKELVRSAHNPDVSDEPAPVDDGGNDNRNLLDSGDAQTLTQAQIEAMKSQGSEGLVQQLVENSKTFGSKTSFAKDKYLRRKKAEWVDKFKMHKLCVADLCRLGQNSSRVPLRLDMLGMILTHSDVFADSNVLMYDESNGVLPAAIMQRLVCGTGKLLNVVFDAQQPKSHPAVQLAVPSKPEQWLIVPAEGLRAAATTTTTMGETVPAPSNENEGGDEAQEEEVTDPTRTAKSCRVPRWTFLRPEKALGVVTEISPQSLIIVAEWNVQDAFDTLYPHLALSGSFAIYCPVLSPLEQLFMRVRRDRLAVQCHILDLWMREYQVIPMRTHPMIALPSMGGYLLTGTKTEK